jgi:hypothetical protein
MTTDPQHPATSSAGASNAIAPKAATENTVATPPAAAAALFAVDADAPDSVAHFGPCARVKVTDLSMDLIGKLYAATGVQPADKAGLYVLFRSLAEANNWMKCHPAILEYWIPTSVLDVLKGKLCTHCHATSHDVAECPIKAEERRTKSAASKDDPSDIPKGLPSDLAHLHGSVWTSIRKGEFIHLADFLSYPVGSAHNPKVDIDEFEYCEWVHTFLLYIRASVFHDPARASLLVNYMSFVVKLARTYEWSKIRAWDRDVRVAISNRPYSDMAILSRPASVIEFNDVQTWRVARSMCKRCSTLDHTTKFCPNRPSAPARPSNQATRLRPAEDMGPQPCYNFFRYKRCPDAVCPNGRVHACPECKVTDWNAIISAGNACATCIEWKNTFQRSKRFASSSLNKGA